MIAIVAVAAFAGLFALWVIAPRYFIRRKQNAANPAPPMQQEEAAPQPAD